MTSLNVESINNLKTLFLHLPNTKATSIQVWFRAGSALENSDNQGIAHFLEHMFFKGTSKRPNNGLAKEVDAFGGEFNAFTSFDYTCYYINAPMAHFVQSTDILIDMVSNPQFLESDLPAEREVVQEEYKRSQDNPSQYNFQLIQQHSFPTGYRHPILGTSEHIAKFSIKQLKEFRNEFYSLANALVVVAGDLSNPKLKEELKATISKHKIPNGKKSIFPEFKLQHEHTLPIWPHHKKVKQATITLAFQAPAMEDTSAVGEDLALSCLGHGETSLLYQRLVKKSSICSHISASTSYFNHGGIHFIRLILPENHIAKAFTELQKCLDESLKNGFTHHELNKIKNQYIASKVYEYESIESLAFSYGHSFAQSGDIESEKKFIEKIKSTELDSVNSSLPIALAKECYIHIQLPEDVHSKSILNDAKKLHGYFSRLKNKKISAPHVSAINNVQWSDPNLKVQEIVPGISFIYRQNTQAPTFSIHAYIKGGLGDENAKSAGIHYLLGKNLTSGYANKPYLSLKKDLDFKSASLNGFSGKNAYGLMMHGLTEHMTELLQHFFGCLLTPTIDEKILKFEKELVFRAIKNQTEDPAKKLFSDFNKTYFQNFSYANDVHGTKESIRSINRKKLLKLHETHTKKDEMVICFSGDCDFSTIVHQVQEALLNLKARKSRQFKRFAPKVKKDITKFIPLDREQTHLFYALPSTELNTREEIYLKILTAHLSGQSSELFLEMRDRQGLCYAVSPVHQNALQAGFWGIYMATSNAKLPQAVSAIQGLIKKLGDKGLTQNELDKTKSMLAGHKVLNLQTNDDYNSHYGIPALHGLGVEFEMDREHKIQNCNLNDLNVFLKGFSRRNAIFTYVGKNKLEK
jgi:zinc protease